MNLSKKPDLTFVGIDHTVNRAKENLRQDS
jgi:hypothetical protein